MKSIIDGGGGFPKSLLRRRSSQFLIVILTERTKGRLDDPNLEGNMDTHLDSASIAKVEPLLHASVGSDTR